VKEDFFIDKVKKCEVKDLLNTFHYLKDESKDFKVSPYSYGLYRNSVTDVLHIGGCCGCVIFTKIPVPEIAVGAFGLQRHEQEGLYELSRLCVHPDVQREEYNITSWFVSRCIRRFRKDTEVKAILSYADSSRHNGTVYRATNFKYYGLSDPKKDFYYANGTKHSRGSVKGAEGEWRERTRKHRFVLLFDKSLNIKWNEQEWKNGS
jgi:hypothetical protein